MRYLLPLLAVVLPLGADEIRMRDGRVIDGEVKSEAGSSVVTVVTRAGGMSATLHLKAADVLAISYGKSDQQKRIDAFEGKRSKLEADPATSADAWWRLAEEAKGLGENVAFREIANRVLDVDADHPQARQALGYVLQDRRWMKPAEAAVARGEVHFRGKWVPAAQRDAVLAEEQRVQAEAEAKAAAAREQRLAELEVARKEADLRAAQRAAEPVPPTVIYNTTYTPVPSIIYGRYYGGSWGGPGCVRPPLVVGPQPDCRLPVGGSGLQVQAAGQGNGYAWGLQYR